MTGQFDNLPDRRATDSLKWRAYDADVLPLWVADMDFPAPEPVIQAMKSFLDQRTLGYPTLTLQPEGGAEGLREVLVERMKERYGWEIHRNEILFLPGVVTGINLACHAIGEAGDGVLIQPPVYMPFLHAATAAGRQRQDAPLLQCSDGSFDIDWTSFEAAISPRTKLFVLCHPHNPVGKAWSREDLERMADICLRHGITLCSDEIHCDLHFDGRKHLPMASLSREVAQNTITLMAPSKTFNLAGLACSFAIIPNPALRQRYLSARQGLVPWVNVMGIVAAEAAYREGQPWLEAVLTHLHNNRRILRERLAGDLSQLRMGPLEATYLAWLDARGLGLEEKPGAFFVKHAKVALNEGENFGPGGEGFVRLNLACSEAVLKDALDRLARVLPSQ